jgi:hypothetical protein
MSRSRSLLLIPAALLAAATALPAAASADPIAPGPSTTAPSFIGDPATARAFSPIVAEQNPFMTKNPNSNIHNDTWMSGSYNSGGPLGRSPRTFSGAYPASLCGSVTFDSKGRLIAVCPSAVAPPVIRMFDPKTLAILASYELPNAADPPGTKIFQNFTGGGYFFLDAKDRVWVATKTSHLFVVRQGADGTSFVKAADYDLTSVLADDERISSALPDFQGRIWFVSKKNGKVGVLDTKTRKIKVKRLGEEIENSFSVASDAVYIVSDKRLYRFEAGKDDTPKVVWKETYRNSGITKPSQVNAGSGTTPDIIAGDFVAIADNDDPMNVVVYRRAGKLAKGQKRLVCEVPVFKKGASATENSLITAGRSIVIENNYGYQDFLGPNANALTEPGFVRIDINAKGTGCKKVWTNTTERAPTVVPKLSTKTGLIYAYTRDPDTDGSIPWYWVAIDMRTGKTVFKQLAGTGPNYNNNYAGLALGPDGTAYLGTITGLVALKG